MSLLSGIDAVLFDMDGLILDSELAAFYVWQDICKELGFDYQREVFFKVVGVGLEGTTKILKNHFGDGFDIDKAIALRKKYWNKYLTENKLAIKEGFEDLLLFLQEKKVICAIVTSTEREQVEKRLKSAGLLSSSFRVMVCADEVERKKPFPDPYLKAASLLNLEAKGCIVIEDSQHGAAAGIAAGMRTIVVPDLTQPPDEIVEKAWRVCKSLREVKEFLEKI